METTIVNTYDDKTNEHLGSRWYINEDEVSFEQYAKFMDEMYSENGNNDGSDENNTEVENGNMMDMQMCNCPECQKQSELDRLEQEQYENCDCEYCVEDKKVKFLSEAVNMISEGVCCSQCLYELLENIYDKGAEDAYSEIEEDEESCELVVGKLDETANITINIDNLTFNDVTNGKDLIAQLQKYGKIQRGKFWV